MVRYPYKVSNFRFVAAALRPSQLSLNRKQSHERAGMRYNESIKMDLKEVGYRDVNFKWLVQDCVRDSDVSDVEYMGSTTRQLHQSPFSSLSE